MHSFRFEPADLPPEAEQVRADVRAFLEQNLADYPAAMRSRSWLGIDLEFSTKLGQAGFLGMTFPKEYGGHGKTAFERYVMLEEVLAAGAPVGGHWMTDRQSGPLILKFGTEEMKRRIIPRIVKGEIFFCIGMSEPDSGSDLASIRTRATRTDGGWLINGSKIWTSGAHLVDYMIALVRTDPEAERKHDGLSQLLIDLKATEGISIRPIRNLAGEEHFNECVFEDAFVPEENLIGSEGEGWSQVMAELAFERSGPERYLSSYQMLLELLNEVAKDTTPAGARAVGRLVAHLVTLRNMSISVAAKLEAGEDPALDGAIVKEVGTLFEQSVPLISHQTLEREPSPHNGDDFEQTLAYTTLAASAFAVRGGTREIVRGIIARGLGLR
ncbi:MAG: acyl-CoA dehydrogenase family protein [Alphaproteobacteria bacterium]|jgi:alkylation response protein AidB-like acyl-CoA dehydrogenase|nr:acyl-CoA dehydrogenase family protein [Alphaproteobacteria bacterium]MDP6812819.1 acyl-CoA dehydrogenase family protein [Alphaproteobacteria bacterium]